MTDQAIEALRAFYAEHRQHLYIYAVSITGHRESAEDAIHHAFQQLLRREILPADLKPYAFRCVRNSALDGMRRGLVRLDSIFAETAAVEPPLVQPFLGADLSALLHSLATDEREAIVLKIYDGLTFQEIARLRNVPLATAASWYRRGLAKMKSLMTVTPYEKP